MDNQQIVVGNNSFACHKGGSGNPAVVFLSGLNSGMKVWEKLIGLTGQEPTRVAYDRLDYGRSSSSTVSQTGEVIVQDLRAIPQQLQVQPPYVLVEHSVGGLYANLFARLYSQEVCGVALIEASYPHENSLYEDVPKSLAGKIFGGLFGLLGKFGRKPGPNNDMEFIDQTSDHIVSLPDFPQIPVAVVSGGIAMPFVPAEATRIRKDCQEKLATMSTINKHVVAEKSGHAPHMTEPEVVLQSLEWVIGQSQGVANQQKRLTLFSKSGGDELIQRHLISLGQPFSSGLDRALRFQWIAALAHGSISCSNAEVLMSRSTVFLVM